MATERAKVACIYGRISCADGRQNLESQLAPVRDFCQRAGWTVYREYTDQISGSKSSRPGLDMLLRDARQRLFNVLVVFKLDRLGRSLSHLVRVLDELRDLGVDFVATSQAVDTTTPTGKLLLGMLAAISEFERDLIRERVITGLARVRAAGKKLGRPRVGVTAEKVAYEYAQLKSIRLVAQQLKISPATVQRLLRRCS